MAGERDESSLVDLVPGVPQITAANLALDKAPEFSSRRRILAVLCGGRLLAAGTGLFQWWSQAEGAPPDDAGAASRPIPPLEDAAKGKKPPVVGAVKAELPKDLRVATVSSPSQTVAAVGSPAEGKEKPAHYRYTAPNVNMVLDIWITEDKEGKVHAKVWGNKGGKYEFVIPKNLVDQFAGNSRYGTTREERLAKVASVIFSKPTTYKRAPQALQEQLEGKESAIHEGWRSFTKIEK